MPYEHLCTHVWVAVPQFWRGSTYMLRSRIAGSYGYSVSLTEGLPNCFPQWRCHFTIFKLRKGLQLFPDSVYTFKMLDRIFEIWPLPTSAAADAILLGSWYNTSSLPCSIFWLPCHPLSQSAYVFLPAWVTHPLGLSLEILAHSSGPRQVPSWAPVISAPTMLAWNSLLIVCFHSLNCNLHKGRNNICFVGHSMPDSRHKVRLSMYLNELNVQIKASPHTKWR
jgi:hypothetical protein